MHTSTLKGCELFPCALWMSMHSCLQAFPFNFPLVTPAHSLTEPCMENKSFPIGLASNAPWNVLPRMCTQFRWLHWLWGSVLRVVGGAGGMVPVGTSWVREEVCNHRTGAGSSCRWWTTRVSWLRQLLFAASIRFSGCRRLACMTTPGGSLEHACAKAVYATI